MQIHSFLAGIANVQLVVNGRGIVIVDAGWPGWGRRITGRVERLGFKPTDVRLILLTHVHVDHAGSAAELRRLTGAPIAAHARDAHMAAAGKHGMPLGRGWAGLMSKWLVDRTRFEMKFEPFEPDILIAEGQTLGEFGLEGYVVHTPGHTRGSISLMLEEGNAIIGDALINLFKVGFPMYWEEPELARESARKIQTLRPSVLYSGHGRPFTGAQLDRYLEQYALKKKG